jgi:glycerophosphoryl diester phosphodiesterase
VLIAHGGGNTSMATLAALATPADYLEVDLWVHRDRFEARHERRLPFGLPWLYERWYLSRLRLEREPLQRLLDACRDRAGLFLDLKTGGERPSTIVARALASLEARIPVLASSQSWPALRAFRHAVPDVPIYYSVDVISKLDLLFSVIRRDPVPDGVSCNHRLLTPDVIKRFHDNGLGVVAWTVDSDDRALELAGWGVDGITTHRAPELRKLLGPSA